MSTLPTPTHGSFGEAVYAHRTRLGLSQASLSASAGISGGYLSEVENGKRKAPPYATALRLARALQLGAEQAGRLAAIAAAERAASTLDVHLTPSARQLLAEIRMAAPLLPQNVIESLRARVREVSM